MTHPTRYTLMFRKKMIINTDPQRRCYNGCNFSEEEVWSGWSEVYHPATKEDGEDSIKTFTKINGKHREFKLLPPTGLET